MGTLFILFQGIKDGLAALDGLERHNIDLLRTTEILGGNGKAASAWSVIANEMRISLDTIDRGFAKLATDMNAAASPALKQVGVSAEDARGKLRPLNDVIGDIADYFRKHAGAANNAALANQLFGRSGYELLPILEQGRAGIAAITEEARKYGLILDAATIERNAAFTFQLKEAQMAGEGLALSLGNALLPGLAALGQAFSKVVSDNLPAFIAGVNRAVSYVIGLVEGMTGMKLAVGEGAMALSNLGSISGDTGTGLDKAASSSQALANAIAKVRDHTKDATDAINKQVASLNAQMAAERFMDQQAKLQQDLANKAHDIDNLRKQQYEQFWLGNFAAAQTIGDQITKDQQDQANLQTQITSNAQDEQTKAKITALETQKKHIEDASNAQIAAMQKAAQGTTAAMAGAATGMGPLFSSAGQAAASKFKFAMDSGAEATGASMGQKLMDGIFGPQTSKLIFDGGGHWHREFTRSGGGSFLQIGQVLGEAIATGLTTALGKGLDRWISDWWTSYTSWLKAGVGPSGHFNQPPPQAPAGSSAGGVFTKPTLTWVAETGIDEAIVPASWLRPGNTMPGASPLPRLGPTQNASSGVGASTSEIERLLRVLIAAVNSGNSSSSPGGGLAALSNLIEDAGRARARGLVGAR